MESGGNTRGGHEGRGRSAGVAIATPKEVNAGVSKQGDHDCAQRESKGRLAKLRVQDVLPCGITILSIYMWHTEGRSDRNLRLLSRAFEEARVTGGPWMIAGDFQQEPTDLLGWAAPMLEKEGASILCTKEATNRPGVGRPARLDYFIVSAELKNAVTDIRVVTEFGWEEEGEWRAMEAKPHAMVAIRIRADAVQKYYNAIWEPRKFGRQKPIGCARAPIVPCNDDREGKKGVAAEEQDEIEDDWRRAMQCAEVELCGIWDLITKGGPDGRWC